MFEQADSGAGGRLAAVWGAAGLLPQPKGHPSAVGDREELGQNEPPVLRGGEVPDEARAVRTFQKSWRQDQALQEDGVVEIYVVPEGSDEVYEARPAQPDRSTSKVL